MEDILKISSNLRHVHNMKQIKREAMKNMIAAGPAVKLRGEEISKQLYSIKREALQQTCSLANSSEAVASDDSDHPQKRKLQYHSDCEDLGLTHRSDESEDTLYLYAVRARKTSSYSRVQSYNNETDEQEEWELLTAN